MGLLRVFGLGLVLARLLGQGLRAIAGADELAHFGDGLSGQADGIGAHVGDQPYGPSPHINALVQLLRRPHGFLRREAQLARRFLLQGGSGEWRGRLPLALLFLDLADDQRALGLLV